MHTHTVQNTSRCIRETRLPRKPTELRKTNLQTKLIFYICFLLVGVRWSVCYSLNAFTFGERAGAYSKQHHVRVTPKYGVQSVLEGSRPSERYNSRGRAYMVECNCSPELQLNTNLWIELLILLFCGLVWFNFHVSAGENHKMQNRFAWTERERERVQHCSHNVECEYSWFWQMKRKSVTQGRAHTHIHARIHSNRFGLVF